MKSELEEAQGVSGAREHLLSLLFALSVPLLI